MPLPSDHRGRISRARLAVEGLSLGDAFGERFFDPNVIAHHLSLRQPPPGPWPYTDDTEMALGILAVLDRHGGIDQDDLAATFASRYRRNPRRGYGAMAHHILSEVGRGARWPEVSAAAFGGQGSMGNGAAMRVAPVGGYFADDLDRVVEHAEASAGVTHWHREGKAGAIAVAVAAAAAWRSRPEGGGAGAGSLWSAVLDRTPEGATRTGLATASEMAADAPISEVARVLGNGSLVVAPDTVPFAVWSAARHLDDLRAALWDTVSALGDRDTTCAIVGSIVSLAVGAGGLPEDWMSLREPLELGA